MKSEFEKTLLNLENEIQQETLSFVGRELHDNIGQLLSLAKLNFNSSNPEKILDGKQVLNQIIKEVRGLSKSLNIDWVESIALKEFFEQELTKIQISEYCQTELEYELDQIDFSKNQKLILMRVTQECLNNVIKHASAKLIHLKAKQDKNKVIITISDDGKGFDPSQKSTGMGMINLKNRMEAIGGEFKISSILEKGTVIKLILPIQIS
jgi:signal transduction histidine kinase